MDSTDHKGAIAESAVLHAAVRLGLEVAIPYSPQRYDLILDLGARLLRVQCKWATRRGDVVVVQCHSTRRTSDGFRKRTYDASEVDALAAYCLELDRCYLLPTRIFAGRSYVSLRLAETRNRQRLGIHWAREYEFESLDGSFWAD